METTYDLETDLNTLVNDYGLISVLEALKQLVEIRAEHTAEPSTDQQSEETEAFRDVARSLTVLIKALPPELDYEIALQQVTHTSTNLDPQEEMLTYGQ
ncbi:MAG TPA: hypothetical protein V6D10_02860 [Trichocoleus sp.]